MTAAGDSDGDSALVQRRIAVSDEHAGQRLDQAAAALLPEFSRGQLQQWIKRGELTVDGHAQRPRDKVAAGAVLQLAAAPPPRREFIAQSMPLDICYQDEHVLVLNKAAGVVVHPGAGNPDGTLLNALLHHAPELKTVPRAGIVHRLDRDTTGLMVVARNLAAHNHLIAQLQARAVHREYVAVVRGQMTGGGTVDAPIGRHPSARTRMAVVGGGGKPAITHYRLAQRFAHFSAVRCFLETGRTHQIRVHMAHIRHPLVGDRVYAGKPWLPAGASGELITALQQFNRQALHAAQLEFVHPASGARIAQSADVPDDMRRLLDVLAREDSV